VNGGTLDLSAPVLPDTLMVTGDYTQGAAATLKVAVGVSQGTKINGLLQAGGTATLGGTLTWVAIAGDPVTAGQNFLILQPLLVNGTFATVSPPPPAPPGVTWQQQPSYNNGVTVSTNP
jgi:hypothetical protein